MATPTTNGATAEKERPAPDQEPGSPDTVGPLPSNNGDGMSLSAGEGLPLHNGTEDGDTTATRPGPDDTGPAHTEDQPATTDAMDLDEQDASQREHNEQTDVQKSPEPGVVRRSGRPRKAPANYEDEYIIPAAQPTSTSMPASRRPKRKAATAAQKAFTSKEDLDVVTNAICTPMTPDELRSYKGWVELESEPWFFQAMLQEMGAPNLKITELFSTDEGSLGALPKPVYGLIFLFPYEDTGEENGEERHDCPDGLWFANQTTSNACATVALMNITMNTPDENLGPELKSFKDATIPLSTVDRGHTLDANDFIRCIHNSVARRTQLLNEDLAWKNKMDEEEREQRRQQRAIKNPRGKGKGKKKAGSKKKKKDSSDIANHYIAYVPHDGKVWEFDGLEDKPLCLGEYAGDVDNWTTTAIETIQVRMAAGIFSNTFNLLAACASPLEDLTNRLAQTLAAARMLEEQYTNPPPTLSASSSPSPWPHPPISTLYPAMKLQSLNNLSWDTVAGTQPTTAFLERIPRPPDHNGVVSASPSPNHEDPGHAAADRAGLLMVELLADLADLELELTAELAGRQGARDEYAARRRDFTPFVHRFLLALAEKGALEEVVANFC